MNVEDLFLELEKLFTQFPDRTFRVGTGEITVSLALDALIPYSQLLIPFFNRQKNALLELKTKSDRIENLLDQADPTNVIVSWSINPQQVIDLEEKGTPSLENRLYAASLCVKKGYRVGFHLDPIILTLGWEKLYRELIEMVFDFIPVLNRKQKTTFLLEQPIELQALLNDYRLSRLVVDAFSFVQMLVDLK